MSSGGRQPLDPPCRSPTGDPSGEENISGDPEGLGGTTGVVFSSSTPLFVVRDDPTLEGDPEPKTGRSETRRNFTPDVFSFFRSVFSLLFPSLYLPFLSSVPSFSTTVFVRTS